MAFTDEMDITQSYCRWQALWRQRRALEKHMWQSIMLSSSYVIRSVREDANTNKMRGERQWALQTGSWIEKYCEEGKKTLKAVRGKKKASWGRGNIFSVEHWNGNDWVEGWNRTEKKQLENWLLGDAAIERESLVTPFWNMCPTHQWKECWSGEATSWRAFVFLVKENVVTFRSSLEWMLWHPGQSPLDLEMGAWEARSQSCVDLPRTFMTCSSSAIIILITPLSLNGLRAYVAKSS